MNRKAKSQCLNVIQHRSFFLMLGFTLLVGGLGWKLFELQITECDFLQSHGEARALRWVFVPAKRGMILDRQGTPLAVSTKVHSLWINPNQFAPTDKQWSALCQSTGLKRQAILAKKRRFKDRQFVYLKRHLSPKIFTQIDKLRIQGVYFKPEYRRYYPTGEMNANVLGLTDLDDIGQSGLEKVLNPYLKGQSGKKRILRDRLGREIEALEPLEDISMGPNVKLSLDQRLQYLAYRNVKAAVEKHQAKAGCALILAVDSGEVLAMVNYPSFNPNDRIDLDRRINHHNMNVTHVFEPGSVMKTFSVISALEQGHITPHTQINTTPGIIRVGRHYVRDFKNYGVLDVTSVVRHSSNIGVAKLALELPPGALWNTYQRFGFGQRTASLFPGERAGSVLAPAQQKGFGLATMAFGYGISVTPLQLAKAYATLGAGGIAHPVTFFKRETAPKGERVISPEVAKQICYILTQVVKAGGGRKAQVSGYAVSGKTGTARKLAKSGYSAETKSSYSAQNHIAIFAGFVPMASPKFSIVVLLDDPKVGGYYSSGVAAPVFSKIASAALRLYNVPMAKQPFEPMRVASMPSGGA